MQTMEHDANTGMFYTYEAYMALLEKYARLKGACHHCWHVPSPRVCVPPVVRICCWCGDYEGPLHGPYAEG